MEWLQQTFTKYPELAVYLALGIGCWVGTRKFRGFSLGWPDWFVRVSLANLPEDTYPKIGQYLRETAMAYVEEWQAAGKARGA